jgi:hypothetical protein
MFLVSPSQFYEAFPFFCYVTHYNWDISSMLKENILQRPMLHFTTAVKTRWKKIQRNTVVCSLLKRNVVNCWCWCTEEQKYIYGLFM